MKTAHRKLHLLIQRLARDEHGGEVLEYVIVMGLLIIAAIASISAFGTKLLARWSSINSSMT